MAKEIPEWRKIFGAAARYCKEHREELGLKQYECVRKILDEVKTDREAALRKLRPYMKD